MAENNNNLGGMKKFILSIFAMLFMAFIFTACEKQSSTKKPEVTQYAQQIANGQKTGTLYSISIRCGHTISECGGNCSVTPYGHVDCQGTGNHCEKTANIIVTPVSASLYTATTQDSTDLTSDPYFSMPARSLYTGMDNSGLPRWLNIPAQFVLRDSTTRLFTFNGVFFSQQQVYKNQ